MKETNHKSERVNKKSPQVWRIFRFKERFELGEDVKILRKSGLHFTKDFVGVAGGDEAVGYRKQFGLLLNGDGLESAAFYGVYRMLVNMAAEHTRAKRGYLLDASDQPLTATQIGRLLHIKTPKMRQILRKFASVSLLEQVHLPEFDLSINDGPKEKEDSGGSKEAPPRDQKRGKDRDARNTSDNFEKEGAPSRTGKAGKGKIKEPNGSKEKVNAQRGTNGETGNTTSAITTGNNSNAQEGQDQEAESPPDAGKASIPPTTTPPSKTDPTDPDALGQGKTVTAVQPAPGSDNQPTTHRRRRRASFAPEYDRHDVQLARRVYHALKLPWDTDGPEGASEVGSFASVWHKVMQQLSRAPPEVCDQLGLRAVREAGKIAKRKASQNKSAVWINTIRKIAAKREQELSGAKGSKDT